MIPTGRQNPTFRFAPSPNGSLHLGHALSALLNADMAEALGGHLLLRMEDIDIARCKPEFETAIVEDLLWLGLTWQQPVRRQSEHLSAYRQALDGLIARGLAYPAFMSRGEVKARVSASEKAGRSWPRDPDGAPHYPPDDRHLASDERETRIARGDKHAWRLDVEAAVAAIGADLDFQETGDGPTGVIKADPLAWGDVVLWRSDAPSSYHLSVTVDDALQGVTHVVRGLDLFAATGIHRLLQELLGLPAPVYHHHRLITGADGHKLSKSNGDTGLAELRAQGFSSADIRRLVGL
ncbi:tRNA glutamyl-Q(34) synthetase GluQRS [Rhizobium sp. RU36D]|uniref:tRNA glutamyl-Q(34) synthetase GluQRS n=1 Tax=Rhizobium sp. RU36D TaxID=1907415 RepID=UPI0009D82277|nr:tRNA glutamyl-Q(34) synthetase GluQRS [Rhizobium sp. RU36D]SMC77960.1 glutamyl-Q tRNA(Asp) synthetase [Rhizobium sp. RU36D]